MERKPRRATEQRLPEERAQVRGGLADRQKPCLKPFDRACLELCGNPIYTEIACLEITATPA